VAITRAKERLYLTRANSRYMYGKREYMLASRFIKEGQPALSTTISQKESNNYQNSYSNRSYYDDDYADNNSSVGYSSSYAKNFVKSSLPKANVGQINSYRAGLKVKHAKFGEGIVITTKGQGDNLIVDVAFKGVGIKSLSAKYAPMEII
ncbi:MAG: hypothetical protein IKZ38_04765, partial [Clostridia bacterium]|nr:hypothetical protein [Clostridia bacterium]